MIRLCAFLFLVFAAAPAAAQGCAFPAGINTTIDQLVSVIREEPACGIPWSIVKRVVVDRASAEKLEAAYDSAIAARPDRASFAEPMKALVRAAAGDPGPLLAFYDGNVAAHPDDKTLPNASCWIRGETGFDLQHAMPFCNAAVKNGREAYALVNRAIVELGLGKNAEALRDLDEALADKSFGHGHPFFARALYARGVARLRRGDRGGDLDLQRAEGMDALVKYDFATVGLAPHL